MLSNKRKVMTVALCILWAGIGGEAGWGQVTPCKGGSGAGYGPQDLIDCVDSADCGLMGLSCCLILTCKGHQPYCGKNYGKQCSFLYSCSDADTGPFCNTDCSSAARPVSPADAEGGISPAQVTVTPFTLEMQITSFAHSPQGELHRRQTIAVRSDASRSITQTVLGKIGLDSGDLSRSIKFSDGRRVTLFLSANVKNTWPKMGPGAVARLKARQEAPKDCVYPGSALLGRDTLESQAVAVVTDVAEEFKVTEWRAPQLGCEVLQYQAYEKQADGTFKLQAEGKSTGLVLGEPDPALFDEQPGFREAKPTEVAQLFAEKYRISIAKEQLDLLDGFDKAYVQGPGPVSRLRNPVSH
jgi:hypothetical protein